MKVFDLNGRVVSEKKWKTPVLGPDSYAVKLATVTGESSRSSTDLVFIRLTVREGSVKILGDTLYWHNWNDYMQYESLNSLSETPVNATISPKAEVAGEIGRGNDLYTITLSNTSSIPAVQTSIRAITSITDKDILPAFYSDNYFSLMPGESKTITVEFNPMHSDYGAPIFELSGWNTRKEKIK